MSTNIIINRKCQHCGIEFQAKTTVTKWCSHTCSSRAAKARIRAKKIARSNLETEYLKVEEKKAKLDRDVYTVAECAEILQTTPKTIYSLIRIGKLKACNLSVRMIRIDIASLQSLIEPKVAPRIDRPILKGQDTESAKLKTLKLTIANCYSVPEICSMFETERGTLYTILKRNKIPKIKIKREVYFSKAEIDKLYKKRDQPRALGLEKVRMANEKSRTPLKIGDCYIIEEVETIFNSTRNNLYGFLQRRAVPTIKQGRRLYFSKKAVDKVFRSLQKESK